MQPLPGTGLPPDFGTNPPADGGTDPLTLNGGHLAFSGGISDSCLAPNVAVADCANNQLATKLDVSLDLDLGLRLRYGSFIDLYGVGLKFGLAIESSKTSFNPTFQLTLEEASVDAVKISFLGASEDGEPAEALVTFTALPATSTQNGQTLVTPAATFNFLANSPGDVVASFPGTLGLHFPFAGGIGAAVSGLRILYGGVPDVTACGGPDGQGGFKAEFTLGDTSDPQHPLHAFHGVFENKNALDWLPITIEKLGIGFQSQPFKDDDRDGCRDPGEMLIDPDAAGPDGMPDTSDDTPALADGFNDGFIALDSAGNPVGIGDPFAFFLILSGGLVAKDEENFKWPITAVVKNLELDIAGVRDIVTTGSTAREVIRNLDGVRIGFDATDLLNPRKAATIPRPEARHPCEFPPSLVPMKRSNSTADLALIAPATCTFSVIRPSLC